MSTLILALRTRFANLLIVPLLSFFIALAVLVPPLTAAATDDPVRASGVAAVAHQPTPADLERVRLPALRPQQAHGAGDLAPLPALDQPLGALTDAPMRPERSLDHEQRLHRGLTWEYCGSPTGRRGGFALPSPAGATGPVEAVADRVDYDRAAEVVTLWGEVAITRDALRLEAARAAYDRRRGEASIAGDVFVQQPGLRLTGDAGVYDLQGERGWLSGVAYRLEGASNQRGTAERAQLLDAERSRFERIVHTTCPPGRHDWTLHARELELDQESGLGRARDSTLRLAGVPVLYAPYFWFPIDGRRRSGLLMPSVGSSSVNGFEVSLPVYWNIAPNMDATITPRLMSRRGLLLGTEFRYLSPRQEVEIQADLLPRDALATDLGWRGALRVEQRGQFTPRWWTRIDYATVSDSRYLQDFGNRLDVTSVRHLAQRVESGYLGDGWRMLARVQQFQTVDDSLPVAERPYDQLPHLEWRLDPIRWRHGLEFGLETQYDYFDHTSLVHGGRLVALPWARWPLRREFGHLIPGARVFLTRYDLLDPDPGIPADQSYFIPSLDLDGTLIFERPARWVGQPAIQTLEPRIYYVFTSFEDQSQAPLFDTTALDFSFASLFRPGRFTGFDRIGDENRLTLGLTSRTLAATDGRELLRASVGQVYHFDDRRVQLRGETPERDPRSSVAAEVAAALSSDWSARAGVQWNPNVADVASEEAWEKRLLALRYAPPGGQILNLAYRFNQGQRGDEHYEDTDLSLYLPVGGETRLFGRWLYSWLNHETIEAFAGIEVGRCCWRVRLLGQHLKTGAQEDGRNSIMLQLELAGLGTFGHQIERVLEQGIHGYQRF